MGCAIFVCDASLPGARIDRLVGGPSIGGLSDARECMMATDCEIRDESMWLDRREIASCGARQAGPRAARLGLALRRWLRDLIVRLQWGPLPGDPQRRD